MSESDALEHLPEIVHWYEYGGAYFHGRRLDELEAKIENLLQVIEELKKKATNDSSI